MNVIVCFLTTIITYQIITIKSGEPGVCFPPNSVSTLTQYFVDFDKKCGRNPQPFRNFVRVSDHSRCGAVRIVISLTQPSRNFKLAGSLSLWRGADVCWFSQILVKDLMSSLEDLSMKILQEFHLAVLEVRSGWRSWPKVVDVLVRRCCEDPDVLAWSCKGPYEEILWRSCWHPPRGHCMILQGSLSEDFVESWWSPL